MKNIQIFALLTLGFFASCQKDAIEETTPATTPTTFFAPPPAPKRLSQRINFANNDFFTLQYNNAGQVIQMEEEDIIHTITYSGTTVHIVDSSTVMNRIVWDFTGQLNAKGFLTTGYAINSRTALPPFPVRYKFIYDKAGYMVKKTMDQNSGQNLFVCEYSYKDGNLVRMDVRKNGQYHYGGIYEYGDAEDKSNLNWYQFDVINNFTGNPNKNLPVLYIGLDNTGNKSWDATFTYKLDADGDPERMQQVISNGNVWDFEYFY